MTSIENSAGIKVFADGCFIGSAIIGCQDGMLSYIFGQGITSELRPNNLLFCRCEDGETFFLDVEFEG